LRTQRGMAAVNGEQKVKFTVPQGGEGGKWSIKRMVKRTGTKPLSGGDYVALIQPELYQNRTYVQLINVICLR
jgi:hypothetical protein